MRLFLLILKDDSPIQFQEGRDLKRQNFETVFFFLCDELFHAYLCSCPIPHPAGISSIAKTHNLWQHTHPKTEFHEPCGGQAHPTPHYYCHHQALYSTACDTTVLVNGKHGANKGTFDPTNPITVSLGLCHRYKLCLAAPHSANAHWSSPLGLLHIYPTGSCTALRMSFYVLQCLILL